MESEEEPLIYFPIIKNKRIRTEERTKESNFYLKVKPKKKNLYSRKYLIRKFRGAVLAVFFTFCLKSF